MDVAGKLAILADAAKYDASCASSGAKRARQRQRRRQHDRQRHLPQLHAGRPLRVAAEDPADQRLHLRLPVLRQPVSSDVPRARFTVDEVVTLTLDFYRRNYIEGLFLSSGVMQTPDYTMEQLVAVARRCARRTTSAATSI